MTGVLGDYGADVIWVEPPGGDPWRDALRIPYSVYNRNKRSIVLDLCDDADRDVLFSLCERADLFVETWRPGVAERLGVGFDTLHARVPSLVYTSISGFGTDGPHRDLPGHDALVHAVIGTMAVQPGARPGPKFLALPFASTGASYQALIGTLAALYRRESDGWGRHVETSLLDGVEAYMSQGWGYSERPTETLASARFLARSGGAAGYLCGDGEYLGVSTFGLGAFDRLMKVLGIDELIPPGTAPLTPEEREVMATEIPRIFASEARQVWIDRLLAADIAAIPVLHQCEVFDDPQARYNQMILEVDDPVLGRVEQVAPPTKFGDTPGSVRGVAPTVDQHGAQIRAEIETLSTHADPGGTIDVRPLLDGVNVLDLGHWYAGPYSSRLLADLGADVIKLEPPRGDGMRGFERAFSAAQAGKRSVALDLKDPELALLRSDLVEWADIIHHNLRPGVAERLGMGADELRRARPELIYLAAPGWGSSGPDTLRQAFAPLMSGYVGASNEVSGREQPPIGPVANEDSGAGMLGAVSLLMALVHRARTGVGQYLELPQLNSTMSDMEHVVRRTDGTILGADTMDGLQLGTGPLCRLYETEDGWLCVVATDEHQIGALGRVLGVDLVGDPRFGTAADRARHAEDLASVLSGAFGARRTAEVVGELRETGVPVAEPVPDNNRAFMDDPENQRLGRVGQFDHPRYGKVREPAVMFRVNDTVVPEHRRAPELGEHTDEVLAAHGYSPEQIAKLRARQSIY